MLKDHRDRAAPQVTELASIGLRNVASRDLDLSGGRLDEPDQRANEGRLARAREPHDHEHLARPDLERHVPHCDDVAGLLAELGPREECVLGADEPLWVGPKTFQIPDARITCGPLLRRGAAVVRERSRPSARAADISPRAVQRPAPRAWAIATAAAAGRADDPGGRLPGVRAAWRRSCRPRCRRQARHPGVRQGMFLAFWTARGTAGPAPNPARSGTTAHIPRRRRSVRAPAAPDAAGGAHQRVERESSPAAARGSAR